MSTDYPFFLEKLSFNLEWLCITLNSAGQPWATIKFETPRAFRFFNESDNFSYIENYSGLMVLERGEGCWIGQSAKAPYVSDYLRETPESRLEDGLRSILIVTPQECVEVISFELPIIEIIDEAGDASERA